MRSICEEIRKNVPFWAKKTTFEIFYSGLMYMYVEVGWFRVYMYVSFQLQIIRDCIEDIFQEHVVLCSR